MANEKMTYWIGENTWKWYDKGLISKIYKWLIQLNTTKKATWVKKIGKRSDRRFLQRRYTNDQQAYEKMLNIANYQRNANPNTIPVRMAIIQKFTSNKCWWGCEDMEDTVSCWWECKLVQSLWKKSMLIPQKTKNRTTNCTHRYIAKENKSTNSKVVLNSNVHSSIIYRNQVWKKSKCPSKDE